MALLYYLEFTDVEGILHRCEINDSTFVGSSTQVYGHCVLQSGSIDTITSPIRGMGLSLFLEASSTLTFEDLYALGNFTYNVTYERDGVILFDGYLDPEGLYQDYVNDKWIIQLDCLDGLSYLDNLAYVDDSTGLPFLGKQKEIVIIANCLKRTKILKNISVYVRLYYTGLTESNCPFDNVYLNSERFIKDDGVTPMSCKEVLISILERYNAVITQSNNEWVIVRVPDMVRETSGDGWLFDSDGVYDTTDSFDFNIDLGSQIDGYYPHWVNANQSIGLESSISAYRINYKYGFVRSYIPNIFLASDGVSTIDDYTINDGTYLAFPISNIGILLSCADNGATKTLTSDVVGLFVNNKIKVTSRFITNGDATTFKFRLKLDNGGGVIYYMDSVGEWSVSATDIFQFNATDAEVVFPDPPYVEGTGIEITYDIFAQPLPDSGDLSVEIYSAKYDNALGFTIGNVNLTKFEVAPVVDSEPVGETHSQEDLSPKSSKIQPTKEVFCGDSIGDLYLGTIYKNDQVTPTTTWYRPIGTFPVQRPILRRMLSDFLALNDSRYKYFNGDVYGYIPYLSKISINNFPTNKFYVLEYRYDALNNITTLKIIEKGYSVGTGSYTIAYEYGNVVEPTIIG